MVRMNLNLGEHVALSVQADGFVPVWAGPQEADAKTF